MNQLNINLDDLRSHDHSNKSCFLRLLYTEFNWPWKILEYIEFILLGMLGIAHCLVFTSHLSRDLVINDSKRYPTLESLSILCPIAGVYGMVFFKLKSHLWLNLTITLLLGIIPIIILIVLLSLHLFITHLSLSVTCIFIPVTAAGLSFYRIIRRMLIGKLGGIWGGSLSIILLLLCNSLFNLLTSILLTDSTTLSNPRSIITYTSVLYLIFLAFIWISIHSLIFTKHPNEIQVLKKEILDLESPSLGIQTLLSKYPDLLKSSKLDFFSNNGHIFASLVILIAILAIEIGVITVCSSTDYPNSAIYVASFYIITVPCFVFLGTLFSASLLNKNDKYCIGLLVITAIPTVFIMWLSYNLYENSEFYYLGILVGVGFPATIVYWLSLSMIWAYNKRSYQYFSAICCLVVTTPLGIMWPLYAAGGMKSLTFWIVCGVLFFGGILVLGLWLAQFVFRLSKELVLLFKEVRKFSGHDLAQYLYSVSFVLGFCLLAFITFKRLDYADDWIGGLVPGCFAVFGFMIFATVLVHRVNLYVAEVGVEEVNLRDIVLSTVPEPTMIQLEYIRRKKRCQGYMAMAGTLSICAISIPILTISDDETSASAGITIIVGLVFVILIGVAFLELKSVLRQFGETVVSYALGCCWLFFLIPVVCLIPVSLSSSESDEEIHSITSWSIGSILIIFMIGVSAGSITLNLLFRRLEYEKIAKYCCSQVRDKLTINGVRVKLTTLRSIYDNIKISGSETVEKVLNNATVYNYRELNEDPDLRYSKEILTLKEISKIKSNKNIPEVDTNYSPQNKGLTLIKFLRKLCTNIEEEQEVLVSEELNPDELVGIEVPQAMSINKVFNVVETESEDENWDKQFMENAKKQEDIQMQKKETVNFDEDFEMPSSEIVRNLDDIEEVKIKPGTLLELMSCKHLELLNSSEPIKTKWLKNLFSMFSNGFIEKGAEPWMNLSDLRHFIRLSGLKPYISYAACDILYVRLTRIYDPVSFTKTQVKINFGQFSNILLKQLGKLKYPLLSYEDAESKIFTEVIYPNLVTNFPHLFKYYPSEISASNDNQLELIQLNGENVPMTENFTKKSEENPGVNYEMISSEAPAFQSYQSKGSLRQRTIEKQETRFYRHGKTKRMFTRHKEIFGEKYFEKVGRCISSCVKGILRCFGKSFGLCLYCLMPTSKNNDTIILEKKSELLFDEVLERRESPSWDVICSIIVTTFIEADGDARRSDNEKQPEMQFNMSNVIGIIGHAAEVYSFASVGFLKQVGWMYGSSFTSASTAVLADNDYWVETFWVCFSASMIFLVLVFPAVKFIKQGRLGLNSDFTVASFGSPQFFLSKLLGLFGKTMYLTILSAMLSSFSCVYEENKWHLMRDSSIECFSSDHAVYFSLAILSILLYYPFATLLFPNITFQDKALDIKFDTSYLVIESQGKVIIAAFGAFFAKERFVWLQLIISICVSGTLFIFNLKMKPCLIPSYNLWKTGGFLAPVWICSCGLLNYYSEYTILSLCLLVIGLGVLLGVLLALQGKLYGFRCFSKLKHLKSLVAGKDVIDSQRKAEEQSRRDINISNQINVSEVSGFKNE